MDGLVTYDEVAEWLPRDICDAIAVSTPCGDGAAHCWQFRPFHGDLSDAEGVARWRAGKWLPWVCSACGMAARTLG